MTIRDDEQLGALYRLCHPDQKAIEKPVGRPTFLIRES